MTGKNFSANNTSGKRKASDFYETPFSITAQLLEVEQFQGNILEPCCGNGAIVKVVNSNGYSIDGFDLQTGTDFLNWNGDKYDSIITNPPFSLAFEFIQQAKKIALHKIAFLLPLSYLHGKKRFDTIWPDKQFPLSKVYVFTRYPMLGDDLREDGKYRTGMMVYAWYIWEKNMVDEPVIRWLDNSKYVIGKEDKKEGVCK